MPEMSAGSFQAKSFEPLDKRLVYRHLPFVSPSQVVAERKESVFDSPLICGTAVLLAITYSLSTFMLVIH